MTYHSEWINRRIHEIIFARREKESEEESEEENDKMKKNKY